MMNKHNILVTGANGQLGHCLQDLALQEKEQNQYFYTDVDTLDICDKKQIETFVAQNSIDIIINAAAFTAVDKAESEIEAAYRLNRDAVSNLAEVAYRQHLYLVHISTDYVFSGETWIPYSETEPVNPKSIYGKSKAAGEQAIHESKCNATIIRTSWLYSEYGHNFVKTMLKAGQEKELLTVVSDQIGGPTYAGDLAHAVFAALKRNSHRDGVQLYHFADEGITSWYDFTVAILEMAKIHCPIKPICTAEYPAAAPRPSYSVFNLKKIKNELDIDIPYWRTSLKLTIKKLVC